MKKEYLVPLTWLRGLAAFFVVVSHSMRASEVQYQFEDEKSYFLPLNILDLGGYGVYLFFALSGCTLYISSKNKFFHINDLIEFYFKRFMRIWPAFLVSLVMYIVFIEFFKVFYFSDKSFWIAKFLKTYTFLNVFQYLSLTFNITGPSDLFSSHYWSLPVEFQYYLMLPIVIFAMNHKHGEYAAPILFSGLLYYFYRENSFNFDSNEVLKMSFTFFGGVLLAKLHERFEFRINGFFSFIFFIFIVGIVGLVENDFIFIPNYIPFLSDKSNFFGLLSLLALMTGLFVKPLKSNNFFLSLLHKYGEISYSIYLFHMLFIGVSVLIVINFHIYGNYKKLFFIFFFTLIGSYIFSCYTFRFIETPSINIGRKIALYISSRRVLK